jgi:hypothetical protein
MADVANRFKAILTFAFNEVPSSLANSRPDI